MTSRTGGWAAHLMKTDCQCRRGILAGEGVLNFVPNDGKVNEDARKYE